VEGLKGSLLFRRKEAKDSCVAVAVLSGDARQDKSFLVVFFKKELLASFPPQCRLAESLGGVPKTEVYVGRDIGEHAIGGRGQRTQCGEAVDHAQIAAATLEQAREIAGWMGKETLTVIDVPGFATSRLDLIASLEAMRMLESGVTSAEEIDRAATLAYRHPVGRCALATLSASMCGSMSRARSKPRMGRALRRRRYLQRWSRTESLA
jgi:hypothetical protein